MTTIRASLINAQQALPYSLHAQNGLFRHQLYQRWVNMHLRCGEVAHKSFADYGGRGISVCERWRDFANFLADMGECPKGMSLDRIDGNGNYEPGNCRWATVAEQNANRRNCKMLTLDDTTKHQSAWAKDAGISLQLLIYRMKVRGMSLADAMVAPKMKCSRRNS